MNPDPAARAPVAKHLSRWNKFGRYISTLVIGCFFLPFFGVSCDGMDVITVSGADMVGGCKPGGLIATMEEETEGRSGEMGGGMGALTSKLDKVPREPLAIVALALVVLAAGAAWTRNRGALKATVGLSAAALVTLVILYFKVGGDLTDKLAEQMKVPEGSMMAPKKGEVDAGMRYGLWLSALLLLGVTAGGALALKDGEPPSPTS